MRKITIEKHKLDVIYEKYKSGEKIRDLAKKMGIPRELLYKKLKGSGFELSSFKDLSGSRFGKLRVISLEEKKNGKFYWKVECDCGTIKTVSSSHLIQGNTWHCGCSKQWNVGKVGDITKAYFRRLREESTIRARGKRKIEFNLSMEYLWKLFLSQNGACNYTNLPISFKYPRTVSLDRIDSSLGYVEGNVQWVHKDVNMMKWKHTDERFRELCRAVAEHTRSK